MAAVGTESTRVKFLIEGKLPPHPSHRRPGESEASTPPPSHCTGCPVRAEPAPHAPAVLQERSQPPRTGGPHKSSADVLPAAPQAKCSGGSSRQSSVIRGLDLHPEDQNGTPQNQILQGDKRERTSFACVNLILNSRAKTWRSKLDGTLSGTDLKNTYSFED